MRESAKRTENVAKLRDKRRGAAFDGLQLLQWLQELHLGRQTQLLAQLGR